MDDRVINLYLSRILSGYFIFIHNDVRYKLLYPDISIKYEADILAQEEYEKNKYNEWLTKDDVLHALVSLGLWSYNGDKELEKTEKDIENLKVDLYKNFYNVEKQKSIRKTLSNYRYKYNSLYSRRHIFDHITLEGYCENIKSEFLLINSLYSENKLVFDSKNIDYKLINDLTNIISNNSIDISSFKKVARSSIWKNYWSANENNLFDRATINWTDEQKTLVVLSKMYDNIKESMDCPPDPVFEDDDMLDGWLILQRREQEKKRNQSRTEKALPGKLGKAQEVFLMANSKEEAKNIYSLNDYEGQATIKEREKFIIGNKDKTIQASKLPDTQRDLIIQSNEQRKNMQKGK